MSLAGLERIELEWMRTVCTFSPLACGCKCHRHLAVVPVQVLHKGGCGDRQLSKQFNQPGEASKATEGWEARTRLQSAPWKQVTVMFTHVLETRSNDLFQDAEVL